jgi:hypothetical protein
MMKPRPIPFAEFRGFLEHLGYVEKAYPNGRVFLHPDEGLLAFRFYAEDEPVHPRDLLSTRRFLDLRGLIEADDFNARLLEADKPA